MIEPLRNNFAPVIVVNFFDLEPVLRSDGVDTLCHKNYCPVCSDGMLLMFRDPISYQLLNMDICTLCGQRFIYKDIELVREYRP